MDTFEHSHDMDNLDIQSNEFHEYGDAFMTDEVFPTRDDLIESVRKIGYSQGFVLKISRSDVDGRRKRERATLVCERSGVYKPSKKDLKYVTTSKKCNCPFKLYAKPCTIGDGWVVVVKYGKHNHERHESMVGHPFPGRLTEEQKVTVINMTKDGVKPNRILNNLKQSDPNNCTTMPQIYNFRGKWRRSVRLPRTQMQHLLNLLTVSGYESWHRSIDDTDVLDEIFWAHPTSITLLRKFNIVLIMDNTYKTNRYKMPLLEIVGQTSTGKTFTAAFCYMSSEKYDSFVWALQQLQKLIGGLEASPKVIVTDFEGALIKAIGDIFPTSTHLLCQFHINCNVKGKLKHYARDLHKVPSITKAWINVVHCKNENEYQSCVDDFEEKCEDTGGFLEYVHRTYLNDKIKVKFVDVWVDTVMHLGNTTSNRVESAHATFKRTLSDNRGDIATCFETMHRMLIIQHTDILASFQISIVRVDHRVNNAFFKDLLHFVSQLALNLIFQELGDGVEQNCDCRIRTTHGLPCNCELAEYKRTGQCIPLEAVHSHWRKLSLFDNEENDCDKSEQLDPTPMIEEIQRRLQTTDISKKKKFISKLREFLWPATTSIILPKEKVKTKGRVSLKEKSVKRDLSYWEHVDMEIASQASVKIASQQSVKKASQDNKQKNSQKFTFPSGINEHIESICDVDADGNCGFRSIALYRSGNQDNYAIVRYDLINEMRVHESLYKKILGDGFYDKTLEALHVDNIGSAPREKWLELPDMGHVIATRYNVALVSIHHQHIWGCTTYLPYMKSPDLPPRIWAIGNVSGVHWVKLNLRSGAPLPPVYVQWKNHCNEDAKAWERILHQPLHLFRTLLPMPTKDSSIVNIMED